MIRSFKPLSGTSALCSLPKLPEQTVRGITMVINMVSALSDRELPIAELVCKGGTNRQIA